MYIYIRGLIKGAGLFIGHSRARACVLILKEYVSVDKEATW